MKYDFRIFLANLAVLNKDVRRIDSNVNALLSIIKLQQRLIEIMQDEITRGQDNADGQGTDGADESP